jgi:hypothetical protein
MPLLAEIVDTPSEYWHSNCWGSSSRFSNFLFRPDEDVFNHQPLTWAHGASPNAQGLDDRIRVTMMLAKITSYQKDVR